MGEAALVLDSLHDNFTLLPGAGPAAGDLPEPAGAGLPKWRPGCGGQVRTLYCRHCGNPVKVSVSCGDRTCPDCRRREFLRLRRRYLPLLESIDARRLALVTLTLRLDPAEDLLDRVQRIRQAWSKLVRVQAWSQAVAGGFSVVEVKWSSTYGGAWNVHIHALVEAGRLVVPFRFWRWVKGKRVRALGADLYGETGAPLTHQVLKAEWSRLTGGSFICDITPIRKLKNGRGGVKGALCYILKYLVKEQVWPAEGNSRWLYNAVMKRRRIVGTFGRWHKTHKQYRFPAEPARRVRPCSVCGEAAGWMSEWELRRLGLMLGETVNPAAFERPKPRETFRPPDMWELAAAG